jgi:hypothetical protein
MYSTAMRTAESFYEHDRIAQREQRVQPNGLRSINQCDEPAFGVVLYSTFAPVTLLRSKSGVTTEDSHCSDEEFEYDCTKDGSAHSRKSRGFS